MIEATACANAIVGLTAGSALVVFWLGPRRWLVTDWARNAMFAAREEFFDVAAAGRISFDDPNYRKVREAINANIRFAHGVSVVRLMLHAQDFRRDGKDREVLSSRAAANALTDPHARWAAHRALNKVSAITLKLLFLRSPLLGALLIVCLFSTAFNRNCSRALKESLRDELQPVSEALQAEALAA